MANREPSTAADSKSNRPPLSAAGKLRAYLAEEGKIIVCPGVYDGFTARIALAAGFDCLYMTGAGTTMSRLGMPDLGVATINDMRNNAAMIASLDRSVPLIADADTGYGGPLMVGRTVSQYVAAGVAALHLEDQIPTKRCGHLSNKQIVDPNTFESRIRAAVNARAQMPGSDIVIIARTDALQVLNFDAAVDRLKGAVRAGADVVFLEGITSKEQARNLCDEMKPTPVLLNMVHGGNTPSISIQEARELGFKIVIFPVFALSSVYTALTAAARELKETGDLASHTAPEAPNLRDLFGVCGLKEAIQFDIEAGGDLYANGV